MRRLILVLLAMSFFACVPVYARMYQWLESASGAVRLSGDPPPWYRNGHQGPRTFVFENGRLIDDTAIVLPPEKEEAMRNAAFREVKLKREERAVRKLERAAMRDARVQKQQDPSKVDTATAAAVPEETLAGQTAGNPEMAGELDAETVEKLKRLIREWDDGQKTLSESP